MNVGILITRCQDLLLLLSDLGTKIFNFIFTSFDFFGTEIVLVEVLFGTALITFLSVKIVAEFIT